jgi:hypothetical protein
MLLQNKSTDIKRVLTFVKFYVNVPRRRKRRILIAPSVYIGVFFKPSVILTDFLVLVFFAFHLTRL